MYLHLHDVFVSIDLVFNIVLKFLVALNYRIQLDGMQEVPVIAHAHFHSPTPQVCFAVLLQQVSEVLRLVEVNVALFNDDM